MEASPVTHRGTPLLARSPRLLAALGDDQLVAHVRRGHEAAFEAIYDRHHRALLSFCRHMLGSREEAEDAVQLTFASAYRDLAEGDRAINLKAWLYTIARNRCLSVLRARRETASETIEISTAGLAEEVQRRADLRELLGDLAELPEQQRAALVLAEIGDLSHAGVAQVVGCETAKVKSLVFQARSGLAERREARETPCAEIREQLATLRGGALRRGPLRRHLKACPGCTAFRDDVKRQRQMIAAILPVVPTLGLKESALAAVGAGGGAGAAVGGAAAAAGLGTAGAGVSGGGAKLLGGLATKVGVPKLVALGVLAGGAAVGGTAAVTGGEDPPVGGGPGKPPAAVAAPQAPESGDERKATERKPSAGERRRERRASAPRAGDDGRKRGGEVVPVRNGEDRRSRGRGRKRGHAKQELRAKPKPQKPPKPKPKPKVTPKVQAAPPGHGKKGGDGEDDDD